MKIFLDTAILDEIKAADAWGVLDGVTTNPSLAAQAGRHVYLEKPMAWATVREALKLGHAEYNVYDVYEIVEKDPGGGVETRVVEPSAVNSVRQ